MGAAAWARYRSGDPHQLAGHATGGARFTLPGPASAGTARLACFRVETVGSQSARQVLPAHATRQKAAADGAVEMEATGTRRRPHHKATERVIYVSPPFSQTILRARRGGRTTSASRSGLTTVARARLRPGRGKTAGTPVFR